MLIYEKDISITQTAAQRRPSTGTVEIRDRKILLNANAYIKRTKIRNSEGL
jgi:hypothetical protein